MTGAIDLHDWDFLVGRWKVRHRRLKARLAGCIAWDEFGGTCVNWTTLGGKGNVDDNLLELPGGAYRAMSVRALDPITARSARWEQAFSPDGGTAWETNWFMDFARDGA